MMMDLIASIFVAIFLFILIVGGLGMLTIFIIDKIVNKPQKDTEQIQTEQAIEKGEDELS